MRQAIGTGLACLLLAAGPAGAPAVRADEARPRQLEPAAGAAHPCTFYRGQAQRTGIAHYATEMLWACEAIAARRAAGLPLGDRLLATELALVAYRDALAAARRERASGGSILGISELRKREIAETTGVLTALQAISEGF